MGGLGRQARSAQTHWNTRIRDAGCDEWAGRDSRNSNETQQSIPATGFLGKNVEGFGKPDKISTGRLPEGVCLREDFRCEASTLVNKS